LTSWHLTEVSVIDILLNEFYLIVLSTIQVEVSGEQTFGLLITWRIVVDERR
jgi:hypothetical protein